MTALTLEELEWCCDKLDAWISETSDPYWEETNDKLTRLVAAARAHLTSQAWREISTAPKVSQHLLMFGDGRGFEQCIFVGRWKDDEFGGQWVLAFDGRAAAPTHWMPLPNPPTNGERDAVLRRTEPMGQTDVVDTGVERAQPETVAAPAITDFDRVVGDLLEFVGYDGCPEIRSAILLYRDVTKKGERDHPLPEPIAAGEEDVVVPFTGITKLDLPAERIIGGAAKANLDAVVIIGFDGDGDFFFSANKADGGEVLWLMELARKKLMEIGDQ
jgi:hypothetical protein